MKKTLVALAALAATGAFAQVTMTGNVIMGYQASTAGGSTASPGSVDAAGFGVDTSALNFAASEDLGGGYKASIALGLDGINRTSGTPAGQNASLTLVTPVGALTMANAKVGDYLSTGLASQGFFYYTWDQSSATSSDGIQDARTIRDSVTFTVPFTAALSGSYTYLESSTGGGLGAGTVGASSVVGQAANVFALNYSAGAMKLNGTHFVYAAPGATATGATQSVTRISGSYDLGSFSLGLGAETANKKFTASATDIRSTSWLASIVVPMGATKLGANYVMRTVSDLESTGIAGATSGSVNGYTLQATHDMSKRTSVIVAYKNFLAANAATGIIAGKDRSSGYSLLLSHSF